MIATLVSVAIIGGVIQVGDELKKVYGSFADKIPAIGAKPDASQG